MAHNPLASVIPGPGGSGDNKRITYGYRPGLQISYMIRLPDAEEATPHLITAPADSKALFVQNRMCGDWYAEFETSKTIVCAIGPSRIEAVENAARKLVA